MVRRRARQPHGVVGVVGGSNDKKLGYRPQSMACSEVDKAGSHAPPPVSLTFGHASASHLARPPGREEAQGALSLGRRALSPPLSASPGKLGMVEGKESK